MVETHSTLLHYYYKRLCGITSYWHYTNYSEIKSGACKTVSGCICNTASGMTPETCNIYEASLEIQNGHNLHTKDLSWLFSVPHKEYLSTA